MRPVGKTHLRSSIVATFLAPPFAHGNLERHELSLRLISAVSKKAFVVRQMASASLHLAYVAAGRLDALFDVCSTPHDWLAGGLLVQEAGHQLMDIEGAPLDWESYGIIACASSLSVQLLDAVKPALAA